MADQFPEQPQDPMIGNENNEVVQQPAPIVNQNDQPLVPLAAAGNEEPLVELQGVENNIPPEYGNDNADFPHREEIFRVNTNYTTLIIRL